MITTSNNLSFLPLNRCGVIPYSYDSNTGNLVYLLAKHKKTGELGDFGGGIKKNEFALLGGLREFKEESRGIFGNKYENTNNVVDKVVLLDNNMAIIFIYIDQKWIQEANSLFINTSLTTSKESDHRGTPKEKSYTSRNKYSDEISELVWVNEFEFQRLVMGEKIRGNMMWKKIKIFLCKIYDNKVRNILYLYTTQNYFL